MLTVFVRRKRRLSDLPKEHRLRGTFEGIAVDVVAVGRPRTHAQVDATELLLDGDRASSLSAIVSHPSGGMVALGSGHGLLPVANGDYVAGRWNAGDYTVSIDRVNVDGSLWFGGTGDDSDYSIVRFPDLEPPGALSGHLYAAAPIPVAPRDVQPHDPVQHYSAWRRDRITGTIVASSISSLPIVLHTDEQINIAYQDVIAVVGANDNPGFSVAGDSGSLVFDDARRAIGFVVGAGKDPDEPELRVSFVLRAFGVLRNSLGGLFPLFFKRS